MIQLELPEAEWLAISDLVAAPDLFATRIGSLRIDTLQRLLRDHTKLVERLKLEIDWPQVLML